MKTEKTSQQPIVMIETHDNADALQEIVFNHKGEGIIAKRKSSTYREGKSHQDWFKIKNWRTIYGFLTHFNTKKDRKSTRLNSSHVAISYAVFCLKKKNM